MNNKSYAMMLPGVVLVLLGILWLLNMYGLAVEGIQGIILGIGFAVWYFTRGQLWALIVSAVCLFPAGIGQLVPNVLGTVLPGTDAWLNINALCVGIGFLYVFAFSRRRVGVWCMWVGVVMIGLGFLQTLLNMSGLTRPVLLITAGGVVIALSLRRSSAARTSSVEREPDGNDE